MSDINNHIGYLYIEYSAAFHMKYKHLFINRIYDSDSVTDCPLIITWSETEMKVDEESGKCLAIATQVSYYPDNLKVSEDVFENMLQAFIIFPGDDVDTQELRLEFVKALLNK